ncbi:hypothetical protein [Nocardioides daphniae]|uniref:hypothetical protein n=1 Tax=Nocardioides daphniae TaxID=402297 RepID=UPI0019310DF0|nr:hypothetical protein [Nocardioides daphniae]
MIGAASGMKPLAVVPSVTTTTGSTDGSVTCTSRIPVRAISRCTGPGAKRVIALPTMPGKRRSPPATFSPTTRPALFAWVPSGA